MEKIYNKLVRDKIIDIIIADNETPIYHQLSNDEYWNSLIEKDKEELEEVIKAISNEERKKELADKLEIIRAMAEHIGYDLNDVINEANIKREKRGGFDKRLFLEKTIK
ncbi:MAG: nucleoside triphosphate pyrophosphohydrolase [Bacilli bacterium]|nr:nucleoside triphosphate pyrophosphohydrolase [Bacilli bacterium]MDD4282630.1 nucleoside triphosphate pyrophosphohydrolase [Bacilli bacterium]MDD4718661.1 nucleoside triphosphate pyrophosphohydrolase [Bacilli bacterium]